MDLSKPDLTAALKDIRAQYENLSAQNQVRAEDWYHSKFAGVTEAAARNQDAIKQSKEELSEYRRQVQARTLEIESLRGHNEALERQIGEMEDRHNSEIGDMQVSRGRRVNRVVDKSQHRIKTRPTVCVCVCVLVCRTPSSIWRVPCAAPKERCPVTCVNTRTSSTSRWRWT